uniref:Uncharacterized protein n=1 Tax=Rhodosorus marinus TaxID=101924 RepID=A0A7S3A0P2_9RHOD|mmetsp:Transcript_38610/g.152432  ORF Transcript_38610/g.152432 Transcript_38610/m.152432 type:complete len:514 (+) Transcript_38610:264-1805(+)
MMELWVTYGSGKFLLEGVDGGSLLSEVRERIERATGVVGRLQKIIWRGRVLEGDERSVFELGIPEGGAKVFLVGSKEEEVRNVEDLKADPTVRPLEGGRPRRRRFEAKPTKAVQQPSKYGFMRTETLSALHDEPQAKALLERLASDRGVMAVMQKHQWTVGALKEMYPKGKVGVDPVCVLGLNVNKGAEIQIRLRTDDLRGFRTYYKLLDVVFHELSHNVHSDHNREFYDLMNQLKREAKELDWTQSTGRTIVTGRRGSAPEFAPAPDDDFSPDYESEEPLALGGSSSVQRALTARQAAVQAAEARMIATKKSSPEAQGYQETQEEVTMATNSVPVPDKFPEQLPPQVAPSIDTAMDITTSPKGPGIVDLMARDHLSALEIDKSVRSKKTEVAVEDLIDGSAKGLQLLKDMGFDTQQAEAALEQCENDTDRAVNWIISRELCKETGASETRSARTEDCTLTDQGSEEPRPREGARIDDLTAMGFSASSAERALQNCSGDLEAAVNWIVSRGLS